MAIFRLSNCKECGSWSKQDVLCGGLWLKILLYRYDNQGAYGRTVVFHTAFDKTVNAQVKKQMDVLVWFWSETHSEVRVKYQTSVMFGNARAEDVVKEILGVLEKLAIPHRLMLFLGMDGPNVNKCIMHKINQVKKEKGYQPLVKCPPSHPINIYHNSFQKGMAQYGYSAEELCLNLYNFFKRSSYRWKDLWNWGITCSWRADSTTSCSESMVVTCSNIPMPCHNQGCS